MIRTLLILALAVWFLILLGRWIARILAPVQEIRRAVRDAREQAAGAPNRRDAAVEKLVPCAHCGTRVPSSRALAAGSGRLVFCSEACRDAFVPAASARVAG